LGKNDAGGSRWNQFSKYWAQAGHKVTILAGTVHYASGRKPHKYKSRFIVREQDSEHVEVLRCYVSEKYNKNFLGRFWGYVSFAVSSIVAGLFCAGKNDIVICTSPPLTVGLTGWILGKFKHIPMVFEVRDLWPESAIDTGILSSKWLIKLSYWLERKSYASASWINVLTPAFEEALIEKKNIDPERISMIPNGADLDIFQPGEKENWVREKHNLQGKFVVTYVGAHGVANQLTQLLEAARELRADPDIVLMLVGDGMQKPMLKEKAEEWKLENVLFVESVPKEVIVDYVAASDVCTAVLKKIDTFKTVYPNKLFDYMSAARPVLLGIDGVARELLEKAEAGKFVEPEDFLQFSKMVHEFKAHPEQCEQYSVAGCEYVKQNFSRRMLANKYLDILTDIVVEK
jgi:glycosyltransferase involved in cell wall biosynthesis